EAMAAGLPVISTPRGAIPDMVEDGRTGRLVPEGDAGALEAALRSLLEEPSLRASMGDAGRRLWAERFTAETCVGRFVEEVEDLLAPRAPERAPGEEALA
ncbi:MAG: glycosyltransferase, partial [Gemmatimonadetes bacterium]|nr:glycosyltransferase [Gemmatimonadota bacterium]